MTKVELSPRLCSLHANADVFPAVEILSAERESRQPEIRLRSQAKTLRIRSVS